MKANKYRDVIIAASKMLYIRKEYARYKDIIRNKLTISELKDEYFIDDEKLMMEVFEGNHVKQFEGIIKKADIVQSEYIYKDIVLYLHTPMENSKIELMKKLIEEIGIDEIIL